MWSPTNLSDDKGKGKGLEASNFAQTCNLLSRYVKEKGSLRDLNLEIGGKVESLEALVKPKSSFAPSSSPNLSLPTNSGSSLHSSLENPIIVEEEDTPHRASTSKDGAAREPKIAQLTIFFCGKVLVFDDYPADKVRDLVHVAKRSSSQMSYGITTGAVLEKPSPSNPREGLPPRPQAAGTRQSNGISSNTCKEKMSPSTNEPGPSSSKAQEHLSPPSEGNGSDLPIARRSSLHRFLEKRKDRAAVRGPYQQIQENVGAFKGDEQLDLNSFPTRD